jgi:hypothetical protein
MRPHVIVGFILLVVMGWVRPAQAGVVTAWNARAMSCAGGPPNPPNRGGPAGLLDIALIQAAVHDAVQAIQGRFEGYRYENHKLLGAGTPEAAAAAASYRMLVGLYGADDPCLVGVEDPAFTFPGDGGLQAGAEAASVLLASYRRTFTAPGEPFFGGTGTGEWRPTPGVTQAANVFMAYTEPFAMLRPSQFRPDPPPAITSLEYLRDYNEVKDYGRQTGSKRTPEQTDVARFWANVIGQLFDALQKIADRNLKDTGDQARLLALASIAAADSQISVYDTKIRYNLWRPITAIQQGNDDGNPATIGEPAWTPFVQTPPYSDHSSGANCLTGSIVATLQLFFRTDRFDFEISSGATGLQTNPRRYRRFSDAAQEMVDVRVLQGIHFRFADTVGRRQGERIGLWTFLTFLRPVRGEQ